MKIANEMDVSKIILKLRKLKLIEKIVLKDYQKRLVRILRVSLIEPNLEAKK